MCKKKKVPNLISTLTSILVSNLIGDSGLKWTCSAVFPPPGTTPSDGVTTRPGTAQTSCIWFRKTAEDGKDHISWAATIPTMCCLFFPVLGGACSPDSKRGSVQSSAAPPFWRWACWGGQIRTWRTCLPTPPEWIPPGWEQQFDRHLQQRQRGKTLCVQGLRLKEVDAKQIFASILELSAPVVGGSVLQAFLYSWCIFNTRAVTFNSSPPIYLSCPLTATAASFWRKCERTSDNHSSNYRNASTSFPGRGVGEVNLGNTVKILHVAFVDVEFKVTLSWGTEGGMPHHLTVQFTVGVHHTWGRGTSVGRDALVPINSFILK